MAETSLTYTTYRIEIPKEFEEVFSHFYVAENPSQDRITKTLLPSFQTILIFSLGAPIPLRTKQHTHI